VSFTLSQRSLNNLTGVQPALVAVVKRAIQLTKVDFGVIEGVRTAARQAELVAAGASQTMTSKHLTGHAVDLMAYIGDRASWELNLYDDIADAMKAAAIELNTPLRWGGAWSVQDIRRWQGTMQSAMNSYIDERRKAGRRPFIDGPHFELP
jgi:peptidoglycan L-alanyl-D-glutamate endopeptidase CwlK